MSTTLNRAKQDILNVMERLRTATTEDLRQHVSYSKDMILRACRGLEKERKIVGRLKLVRTDRVRTETAPGKGMIRKSGHTRQLEFKLI